jgi:predicted transcriptional regulator
MPLNLNDLMKKAKAKGIGSISTNNNQSSQVLKHWQQESILFSSNESTTNRQQTDNKLATNRQQTGNKAITTEKQTDNKVGTQPTTQSATNWQQTSSKPATKIPFSSLVGLQRSIIIFMYNECKFARSKSTKNLSLEYIGRTVNVSMGCVKTTIQRLEIKGFIERIEYKNGRGGWSKYSMPDHLYQELLQHETDNKLTTNWQQSDNKLTTQPITQPTTSFSSSGSINYLNTTTTGAPENSKPNNLNEEWLKIDIESLSNIGFTKTHLMQISSQNILTAELVQVSIYAFAFDLQENDKAKNIKGDPISFFMGILRNGKPYAPPSNYESPQDKAMREYKERMLKIEQGRAETEKEAINLAFNDWFMKLTDAQKIELLPEMFRRNTNNTKLEKSKILESSARSRFEKEIWPSKKQEIIGNIENSKQELQNQIPETPIIKEQEVSNVENN